MQSKHIQFQIKKNDVLNSLCNINLVCLSTVNKITIKLINLTYLIKNRFFLERLYI